MSSVKPVDVAVVGGGIVGLSIAYESSRRGLTVALVERGRAAAGATGVAAGMLAPAAEAEATLAPLVELGILSLRMYPEFVDALERETGLCCEYRTEGSMLVALDQDHRARIEHHVAEQRRLGLPCRPLSVGELREREPLLSPRAVAGWLAESDHQVDPRALASALLSALANRGATVIEQAGEVSVAGPPFEIRCECAAARRLQPRTVVVAAGAWACAVHPVLERLPLRPVKGQVLRLRGPRLARHVIRTPDVYLVPRQSGELVVGATSEEIGFDDTVTAGATMSLLDEAFRVLPAIYDTELAELRAGFRPALRNHLPGIGATGVDGLLLATGHYRNGILLAPATASLLVEQLVSGVTPEPLRRLSPLPLLSGAPDAEAIGG